MTEKKRRMTETFDPAATEPFAVSRSKIDLFLRCPRCFYLDRRLGIARPRQIPFSLNNAVDEILKREFDIYRAAGEPHPIMVANGLGAVPLQHPSMEAWRDALERGIRFVHEETNLEIHGGIDDIWQDTATGDFIIVDYKATAKAGEVTLDGKWQASYKTQAEVYQWLFRRNGFPVSDTAYFVYLNGKLDRPRLDERLEFTTTLVPHVGSHDWIEPTLAEIATTLRANSAPTAPKGCDYCRYTNRVNAV